MAFYPIVEPVSVSQMAAVVICPHCGAEEHQQMQQPGKDPIKPGDKILFRSICTQTLDTSYLIWGCTPNQGGYYIQFPTRKAIDDNSGNQPQSQHGLSQAPR
jgi:hypothetical protein